MIKEPNKIVNDINRALSSSRFAVKFYSIWFLIVFFVIGLFGVYPAAKMLYQKYLLIRETRALNVALDQKIEKIKSEKGKLEGWQSKYDLLDKYLPDDYQVQNYMIDLSFSASKSGYGLTGFRPQEGEGAAKLKNAVSINAEARGIGNPVNLVKDIEALKRVTQVNQVWVLNEEGGQSVRLDLTIFKMGED